MKDIWQRNLFLEHHDEELKGKVHVVSRVKAVPEREEEQRYALWQFLAAKEPQSLEHVSSDNTQQHTQLECGPVPNVMAALPNIGGALCSMPQSLADAHY